MASTVTLPSFSLGQQQASSPLGQPLGGNALGQPLSSKRIGQKVTITSVLNDRTPAEPAKPLGEAQVIWGGPSNFDYGQTAQYLSNGPWISVAVQPGEDGEEEPPFSNDVSNGDEEEAPKPPTIVREYTEVARNEKTVRVTGSNGAYVDVAVIVELLLQAPSQNGVAVYERYIFKDPDNL